MSGRRAVAERLSGRAWLLIAAAFAATILSFLIAIPRSGGPDEPAHMVVSAALLRGDLDGEAIPGTPGLRNFDVPYMVGRPNPECWAFKDTVPAACAAPPDDTRVTPTVSSAFNYPPYAYVLPGLASFVPSPYWYAYVARALMAVIPVALLVAAFARLVRHDRLLVVPAAFGITPIVWYSLSIVNPSAIAIAGGLALWTALLTPPGRRADLLLLAAWAAVLLPRRDGPVWALLIVLCACALLGRRPSSLLPEQQVQRWAVLGLAVVPVVTAAALGQGGLNLALSAAALGLVVVEGIARLVGPGATPAIRVGAGLVATLAAVVAWRFVTSNRPGGDGSFDDFAPVIGATSRHLEQVVGWLGWTDSPAPTWAMFLWWGALTGIAVLALIEYPRALVTGACMLGAGIVTAWVLEFGQGDTGGLYWQARYTMPLLVGLPLVLAWRPDRVHRSLAGRRRLDVAIAGAGWLVVNAAFISVMYRWGAGVNETSNPFRWIRWDSPLHPALTIAGFVATTALFWFVILTVSRPQLDEAAG